MAATWLHTSALPGKKIKHITAPENINTQALLQWYAEQQVKALQYVGIGEDFTGPLRPQTMFLIFLVLFNLENIRLKKEA